MKKVLIYMTYLLLSLSLLSVSFAVTKQEKFNEFIQTIKLQAKQKGISENTLNKAFKDVKYLHKVIHQDRNQPEFKRSFSYYKSIAVSHKRVKLGSQLYRKHQRLLQKLSEKYQVAPQYLLAIWGLETNYGRIMGKTPEFSALATLAFDKRRSHYFKAELFAALKIVDTGRAPMSKMIGSWAGAMGQCQLMPTDFIHYAVDYDNNGKPDIWNNVPDVLASIANFFYQSKWNNKMGMVYPVTTSKTIKEKYLGLKFKAGLAKWLKLGVKLPKDMKASKNAQFSLLLPGGVGGPAYLVYYHNFVIIREWNPSNFYALGIGLLANQIKDLKSAEK